MPAQNSENQGGSAGGNVPPSGPDAVKAVENLTAARTKSTKGMLDDIKAYEEHIEKVEKELKVDGLSEKKIKELTKSHAESTLLLKGEKKALDELIQSKLKDLSVTGELLGKWEKAENALKTWADKLNRTQTFFHTFNLEVQKGIETSGRFAGAGARGHQVFEQLRNDLKLTRESAKEFIDTWSSGLRLGATNQQLVTMTKNLRAVYGAAEGLKLAQQVVQTPMTAYTMQGVMGGDQAAIMRTMRTATPAQARAIVGMGRTPQGLPQQAADAVKFEAKQVQIAKMQDDVQLGVDAAINAGIGPDMAAVVGPVMQIASDVRGLLQQSKSTFDWFKGTSLGKAVGKVGGGLMEKVGGGLMESVGDKLMDKVGDKLTGKAWDVGKKLLGKGGGGPTTGTGTGIMGRVRGLFGGGKAAAGGEGLLSAGKMGKWALQGGKLLKIGGSLGLSALGEGLGMAEEHMEEGAAKQTVKYGGKLARVGGWAMAGSMVMPGVGTAIGGGIGGAVEFKDEIVSAFSAVSDQVLKWGGVESFSELPGIKQLSDAASAASTTVSGWASSTSTFFSELTKGIPLLFGKPPGEEEPPPKSKEDIKKDLTLDVNTQYNAMSTQIAAAAHEMAAIPEVMESQIVSSRSQTAVMAKDPTQMFDIAGKASISFTKELDYTTKMLQDQEKNLQRALMGVEEQFHNGKITEEERNDFIKQHNLTMQDAIRKTRGLFEGSEAQKAAKTAMQRLETRTGQIGEERAAGRAEFARTGAITGDMEAINKLQETLTQGYKDNLEEVEIAAQVQRDILTAQKLAFEANANNTSLSAAIRDENRHQATLAEETLKANDRKLAVTRETMKGEQMAAEMEMIRESATSAEKSAVFRRAKQTQELAKAQESLAKMRGGRPEAIGAIAAGGAAAAEKQLDKFMETFATNIATFTDQMNTAYAANTPEGEALGLQIEEQIFNLKKRELELTQNEFESRMNAATAEERHRQDLIGANKRILEIQNTAASRVGASWRVQMEYQQQIINLSQQDLQSSRKELDQMAKMLKDKDIVPEENLEYLKKLGDVTQKQADLQEATIGKQRSFLEQAMAAGFGMGGGTKVLPNINKRIFGEVVKDYRGLEQQGVPLTMQEQRGMLMGGMGANVFGGIGSGLPAVPVRPGLAVPGSETPAEERPFGGAPGAPGAGENGKGTDVSGNFAIEVKADQGIFVELVRREVRAMGNPGSVMG